jgi:hypothetical protein
MAPHPFSGLKNFTDPVAIALVEPDR